MYKIDLLRLETSKYKVRSASALLVVMMAIGMLSSFLSLAYRHIALQYSLVLERELFYHRLDYLGKASRYILRWLSHNHFSSNKNICYPRLHHHFASQYYADVTLTSCSEQLPEHAVCVCIVLSHEGAPVGSLRFLATPVVNEPTASSGACHDQHKISTFVVSCFTLG